MFIKFEKDKLIKSPLNYIGGKFKLLPQILPLFPSDINTFVDLFCGGANVAINVKANKIIAMDIQKEVIDFLNHCLKHNSQKMLHQINLLIEKYQLTKTNREGYLQLRNDYNQGNRTWDMFYTLVCYSFNNQIRFNSKGEFNMPFGMNRSSFNSVLQQKFIKFVDSLKNKNIEFYHKDFRELDIDSLTTNDFVYSDPPYQVTTACYNENGGWDEKDDIDLLQLLDKLNERKVKFALSNVLQSKGKSNDILKEWVKKYKVHMINAKYGNCNYQRKEKDDSTTVEVLVTNY